MATAAHPLAAASLDDLLRAAQVVPVLTIHDVEDAVPLARALVAGGVTLLEVTLRTLAGAQAARDIMAEVPGAIVGLGTVLTELDLALAKALDVPFAFSPGAPLALMQAAREMEVRFVPGIQTASELMSAASCGFHTVKFFPAEPAGGLAALRALAGPFPTARFCPTGGITEAGIEAWLALPNVVAVGGSWLASAADIGARDWPAITARAARLRQRLAENYAPPQFSRNSLKTNAD